MNVTLGKELPVALLTLIFVSVVAEIIIILITNHNNNDALILLSMVTDMSVSLKISDDLSFYLTTYAGERK